MIFQKYLTDEIKIFTGHQLKDKRMISCFISVPLQSRIKVNNFKMGTKLTLKCNKCGYNAISSAGRDYGLSAITDTYVCRSCRNIVDVYIGENGKVFDMMKDLLGKIESDSGIDFFSCPECGTGTHLESWDIENRSCPRCGGKMKQDTNDVVMNWD